MPESYLVGRQRPIPSSKFFNPRNRNFSMDIVSLNGNFGYKVVSCRTFRYSRNAGMGFNKTQMVMAQKYFSNAFSPLLNEIKCYI
jgi:hypothetical protein